MIFTGPFPNLQVQPDSGLDFPWAEFVTRQGTTSEASFGPDGVSLGMSIIIHWDDLILACQQLLGYSYVNINQQLSRILPWQHPLFPQLWCTRIVSVRGLQFAGKKIIPITLANGRLLHGQSAGYLADYTHAILVLQFSRPPYTLMNDGDPLLTDAFGNPEEWLRYTEKEWAPEYQMLNRIAGSFSYTEGRPRNATFNGPIGTRVGKYKLKLTWFQVPQTAIYNNIGLPSTLTQYTKSNLANLQYKVRDIVLTPAAIPDGGYPSLATLRSVNGRVITSGQPYNYIPSNSAVSIFAVGQPFVIPTPAILQNCTGFNYEPGDVLTLDVPLAAPDPGDVPLQVEVLSATPVNINATSRFVEFGQSGSVVLSIAGVIANFTRVHNTGIFKNPVLASPTHIKQSSVVSAPTAENPGGGPSNGQGAQFNIVFQQSDAVVIYPGSINDDDFLGCPRGTLLLDAIEIIPRPLQLPPELMQIFTESVQLQYNVVFHLVYFDPPIGPGVVTRGHNCFPWPQTDLWYPAASTLTKKLPFDYTHFPDMFSCNPPLTLP